MRRRLPAILWMLKMFFLVCLLVLSVDVMYVLWPYPGTARGIDALKANLSSETALIGRIADTRSWQVIQAVENGAYDVVFGWTGLDTLMHRAADPAPLSSVNETMRSFMKGFWVFLETAAIGLRLFALRLGILILALPLFLIVGLAAGADGLAAWYIRRCGAGRESGFIYHRAKRGLTWSAPALWLIYLVPPIPLDPRWIIPPFLFIFGITVRATVAHFKKYL